MIVVKNVYKCSLPNPGVGAAFILKVATDLKDVLEFDKALVSPVAKTITTDQDFDHPDYPLYNVVEVEEPDIEAPEEPEPQLEADPEAKPESEE
ncbi:hypothetical protein [Yersinia ruckeri]|uniref:hypothetical protein n=1 Tax=Yersinia ruckeri TaxID=29486 RepID=UPI0022375A03|nr:hypothetical protein [Yersinia ruckeri]MCW6598839.1 hypothetical protein [Yersinia ruckeri]